MPKTIPLIETKKWLQQSEKGDSIAAIAKRAKHDIRTVTRGIDQARHELEAREAHSQLLKDALQRHQEDLSETISSLQSVIGVVPPLNYVFPVNVSNLAKLTIPQGKAEIINNGDWTITLGIESTIKWELLLEHLRRDSIWKVFSQWKSSAAMFLQTRIVLYGNLVSSLRENTNLKIVENIENAGKSYLLPAGVQALYAHALNLELGIPSSGLEKELNVTDNYLSLGQARTPVLLAPGAVKEYKARVILAYDELEKSPLMTHVSLTYNSLNQVTEKTHRAIEDLSLLRLVPGQCRVCRRLGL